MPEESKNRVKDPAGFLTGILHSLRSSSSLLNVNKIFQPLSQVQEIGVLIGLLSLCAFFAFSTPHFFTAFNLLRVVRQISYIGIMAIGMVFVLSLGEVDLSIGSLYNLVQVITAYSMQEFHLNIWPAVLLGIGAGIFCGFLNGILSITLRIPMIIVTLGTMSIYRGIALVMCKGRAITNFPKENVFFNIGGGTISYIPMSVIVMVIMGIIFSVIYTRTTLGRHTCAIGSNKEAARVTGIRIFKTRLLVTMLMGFITAVSGLVGLAFLQTADPSIGQGYELLVIAAAIIGGTALSGGSGTIIGAILGAIIIGVIQNGLLLMGFTMYWSSIVTGIVIIIAVAINSLVTKRQEAG